MIKFECANCGKTISVKAAAAGRQGKCPSCGETVQVPKHAAISDDEIMAALDEAPPAEEPKTETETSATPVAAARMPSGYEQQSMMPQHPAMMQPQTPIPVVITKIDLTFRNVLNLVGAIIIAQIVIAVVFGSLAGVIYAIAGG